MAPNKAEAPQVVAAKYTPTAVETSDASVLQDNDLGKIKKSTGAESGALLQSPPSAALSLLSKLLAGLTDDERAALVRVLQGEG